MTDIEDCNDGRCKKIRNGEAGHVHMERLDQRTWKHTIPKSEVHEFTELFNGRSYQMESTADGKIISVKTNDQEITSWLKMIGFNDDTHNQPREYFDVTEDDIQKMIESKTWYEPEDPLSVYLRPEILLRLEAAIKDE